MIMGIRPCLFFFLAATLFLAACGAAAQPAPTQGVAAINTQAAQTVMADLTRNAPPPTAPEQVIPPPPTETAVLTPVENAAIPTPNIPSTPTLIPDSWQWYTNSNLHVRFRFPGNWQAETPTRYSGSDGYFELKSQPYPTSVFDTFRTVCVLEANKDKPAAYGAYPLASDWQGWDPERMVSLVVGCKVTPSNGHPATQLDQAVLFARNPYLHPENILLVLKTDSAHFEDILSTLRFVYESSPYSSPPPSEASTQSPTICAVVPGVPPKDITRFAGLVMTEYAIVNAECDPKRNYKDFQLHVRLVDTGKPDSIAATATQPSNKIAYEYTKDHLFPIGSPSQVNITRDGEIIYSMSLPQAGPTGFPVRSLWTWGEHWVLELENVVVQEGEIQNLELGYDEMFEWHLMNGKPFYFYRKDNSFGLVYDGQTLPNRYDDVIHGLLCCDYSVYEIFSSPTECWFYARKGGVWYLVSVLSGS